MTVIIGSIVISLEGSKRSTLSYCFNVILTCDHHKSWLSNDSLLERKGIIACWSVTLTIWYIWWWMYVGFLSDFLSFLSVFLSPFTVQFVCNQILTLMFHPAVLHTAACTASYQIFHRIASLAWPCDIHVVDSNVLKTNLLKRIDQTKINVKLTRSYFIGSPILLVRPRLTGLTCYYNMISWFEHYIVDMFAKFTLLETYYWTCAIHCKNLVQYNRLNSMGKPILNKPFIYILYAVRRRTIDLIYIKS